MQPLPHRDHLEGRPDGVRVVLGEPGNQGVGVSHMHHHRAEDVAVPDQVLGFLEGDALAAAQPVQFGDVSRPPREAGRVDDPDAVQVEPQLGHPGADLLLVAEQDRRGDLFVEQDLAGAEHLGLLAFREHHPLGLPLRLVDHHPHDFIGLAEPALELLLVLFDLDRLLGHPAVDGRLGHRRRLPDQHARIERLGDDVLATELHTFHAVGAADRIRHVFLGQRGQRPRGRQLHRVVDGGGAHVEGAAEDERKAEDVVHLVGEVGAPGGHDYVGARTNGQFVGNLGVRVGHGEDDGILGHAQQHLRGDAVGGREADEDVGARKRLGQRAAVGRAGEALLVLVHPRGAALVEHALGVAHEDVVRIRAQPDVVLGAGDGGGAGAVEDHLDPIEPFVHHLDRVQQRGPGNDRRAVLVVVEDRDLHRAPQFLLDLEALRGLDVLQVDATKGRFQQLAGADHLFGVLGGKLDVEHVYVGEALEQHRLAFHHRFAGLGADVAQTQNGRAVRDHPDQVALGGVTVSKSRVAFDLQAGNGHARRVGQAQIALRLAGLGRRDGQLACRRRGVVFEGIFVSDHACGFSLPQL